MSPLVFFDPQPAPGDLPARMPSPFAQGAPHPLARRAADAMIARLGDGVRAELDRPGGGKMFGVLVVEAPDGRIGWLGAFSGMLGGAWRVDGFVPPLFDERARDAVWPAGEAELAALEARHRELHDGDGARAITGALAALDARHLADAAELEAEHRARRQRRHDARRALADDDPQRAAALAALAHESRGDTAEGRRLEAAHAAARAELAAAAHGLELRRAAIALERGQMSRGLWQALLDGYQIASARGDLRNVRALFAPAPVPGGAGDCAAPKLIAHAHRRGLRPIALAEVWLGAPPATGGRHAGTFYPACRGKCGPILPHQLDGVPVDDAPVFGGAAIADDEPRVVFEDAWLIVVDKPCGLLSVPGRGGALRDSVLTRLRRRWPDAGGPLIVHRLDLDTSGLLVAAKDADTHAALQRAFARREIDKRYVAWLDGEVAGEGGEIALALRVDVDDRPRQIHDPVHGKPAVTTWHVLARAGGRTRVAFCPHTGRTHQLRVHAAHPLGLAAPIVGDRLYGRAPADGRLLLHAEALAFTHPHTGATISLERPAPF